MAILDWQSTESRLNATELKRYIINFSLRYYSSLSILPLTWKRANHGALPQRDACKHVHTDTCDDRANLRQNHDKEMGQF